MKTILSRSKWEDSTALFWRIWSPTGKVLPEVVYYVHADAHKAAENYAKNFKKHTFVVLKSEGHYKSNTVVYTSHQDPWGFKFMGDKEP